MLTASRDSRSLHPLAISDPKIADLVSFIKSISWGRITGKLRMVIKVALFRPLEAMAEIIVKLNAKPLLPSNKISPK